MSEETGNDSPELTRVKERLRTERSTVTGLELDELKLRALSQARATKPVNRTKGQLMKSRFALLSMIVLGLLMSSTGATLAISGSSGTGSAGTAQYRTAPNDDVLGDTDEQGTQPDDGDVQGDDAQGDEGAAAPADAQEVRQVAATGSGEDSLAFTGFLAIPLLIGGVALLGSGAMLRWKSKD